MEQPLEQSPQGTVQEVAPWGRRLANLIVDFVLLEIAVTLLVLLFANTDFIQSLAKNRLAFWLFGIGLRFLYYFVFETAFGRTPAKFITGTKVVMQDGSKPDAGTIAKRTLSRFVPLEWFSGKEGTWWHDRWTSTQVVRV